MIRLFKHYVPQTVLLLGLVDAFFTATLQFALVAMGAEGATSFRSLRFAAARLAVAAKVLADAGR